jgi:hypothetical protein
MTLHRVLADASRPRLIGIIGAGVVAASLILVAGADAPDQRGSVDDWLRHQVGFSAGDLRTASAGTPVARSLESADHHDLAAAGLIRIAVTPTVFVDHLRDITRFKSDAAVRQIGKFSAIPRFDDLASLTWAPEDLKAFQTCRVSDCDVRLTARDIARFRGVDWTSAQRDQHASDLAKQLVIEATTAYLRGGDAALEDYRDREQPVSPHREFATLVAESPSPLDLAPAFRDYLVNFPRVALPEVESFVYWSKEHLAFHDVVSVTHVAIYHPPASPPLAVLIASRQIYASRYFDASLGMTAIVDRGGSGDAAPIDLLYLNRSRTDELGGFWGAVKRGIVRSRTRAALHKYLGVLKARLERDRSTS